MWSAKYRIPFVPTYLVAAGSSVYSPPACRFPMLPFHSFTAPSEIQRFTSFWKRGSVTVKNCAAWSNSRLFEPRCTTDLVAIRPPKPCFPVSKTVELMPNSCSVRAQTRPDIPPPRMAMLGFLFMGVWKFTGSTTGFFFFSTSSTHSLRPVLSYSGAPPEDFPPPLLSSLNDLAIPEFDGAPPEALKFLAPLASDLPSAPPWIRKSCPRPLENLLDPLSLDPVAAAAAGTGFPPFILRS
ncbi:hypothetical protein Mapa_008034 [Marchantia paleacea]|nr:hypothetical protein Mapa_008034 [Marchantia paleacea]